MSSYTQMGMIRVGKINDVDTTPWQVHQQMYEMDYIEDEKVKAQLRHRREMDYWNQRKKEANRREFKGRQDH